MDLMNTLQQSVTSANPVIDATSVSGMFIQSICCLGFAQLSFAETGRLWKHFQNEVQEATELILQQQKQQQQQQQEQAPQAVTGNTTTTTAAETKDLNDGNVQQYTDEWSLSPDQMENLLRQVCQRLGPTTTSPSSTLSQVEDGINHLLQSNPELPSAHFLRFLHCLRTKERVGAIDALHAYSDYVVIRRRHGGTTGNSNASRRNGRGGAGRGTNNNNTSGGNGDRNHGGGDGSTSLAAEHQQILQFAAILLAALHYETGDYALARLATEEAVRVAQQSQDAAGCVAYSLGWLSQTAAATTTTNPLSYICASSGRHISNNATVMNDNAREWMARCVERSVEANLRSLVAGANLSRIRQMLLQQPTRTSGWGGNHSGGGDVGSLLPSLSSSPSAVAQAAWALLSAAATTESTETAAASTHFIPPNDRPIHMTHFSHGDAALSIVAQQRVVAAAIWDAYNQPASSGLASFLALLLSTSTTSSMSSPSSSPPPSSSLLPHHPRQGEQEQGVVGTESENNHDGREETTACLLSSNHVATAIQNVARTALYGSEQSLFLLSRQRDSSHKDASTIGIETNQRCIYGEALLQISLLRRRFGVHQDSTVLQEMALILHEWAVRRGDLMDAQAWMRFLFSSIHPGMANQTRIEIDVRIQQSLLYSAQKQWDRAKQILKDQLSPNVGKTSGGGGSSPIQTAWILIHLTHLLVVASGAQRQQSSITNALPYILQCLALCDEHGMDGLHAVAMSVLAQVHVQMLRYDSAIAIIEACLPKILQQGHVWFQAEAFLTLARAHLLRAKRNSGIKNETASVLSGPASQTTNQERNMRKSSSISDAAALQMAIRSLANGKELFERCQDGNKLKEVYYLQAHTWDLILHHSPSDNMASRSSCTRQRDDASEKFLALSKYLADTTYTNPLHYVFENVLLLSEEDGKLEQLANRHYV